MMKQMFTTKAHQLHSILNTSKYVYILHSSLNTMSASVNWCGSQACLQANLLGFTAPYRISLRGQGVDTALTPTECM